MLLGSHLDSREECGKMSIYCLFGIGCVEVLASCVYVCCRISVLSGTEWGVCRGFQAAIGMERGGFG